MTEEEAKTKRCCGPKGCGRYGKPDGADMHHRFCIGSACMAFRSIPDTDDPNWPDGRIQNWCGLAGPEGAP